MDREDYEKAIRELDPPWVVSGPAIVGGWQILICFRNMWGASIIQNDLSRGHLNGLAELAVIGWADTTCYWTDWDFAKPSPIPRDKLGWLTPTDVVERLKQIMELPSARPWPYGFTEMLQQGE